MNELERKADFLMKRNDELNRELRKKGDRIKELEIAIKVLRRLNGEENPNG